MERKVGDVFEYKGLRIRTEESHNGGCIGCFFYDKGYNCVEDDIVGYCSDMNRRDCKNVYFKKIEDMEERTIKLSLEKAREYYNKGGELREIALQVYRKDEMFERELPKTWEEYLNIMFIDDEDKCKEATIGYMSDTCRAYSQLRYLREYYRQGWKPDWLNSQQPKYYILENNGLEIDMCYCSRKFLCFQTQEIAEQFLENFRDLIIKADIL